MTFSALNLLLVLVSAFIGGRVALRLGYPAVLGEILMGIVLGPPLLGLMHPSSALMVLADLGVLLMMVYVGMEVSLEELKRASRAGVLSALGGFLLPFALGIWIMLSWNSSFIAALFIGVAMGVTSLATKSRILLDLKILDTRIANVMMAGALVTDTLSLLFFAGIISVATAGSLDVAGLGLLALKAVVFFVLSWFLGVRVFPFVYRWLRQRGLTQRSFYATLALMIALAFAELAELAGLHGVIGAFLAGMFLREAIEEKRLSHELTGLIRDVSVGFLAPVFFLTAGFEVTFAVFRSDLGLLVLIISVATVAKILGTLLFYRLSGGSWREGLVIGLGMNDRGAVEIILAGVALRAGLIDNTIFSILVMMAVVTTATVPLLLTWGIRWLERHHQLIRNTSDKQRVIIVGAGPVARLLAAAFARLHPVTLIDRNAAHCHDATRAGLSVLQGDALDDVTLLDAGVNNASTLIALTPNSESNVLIAKHAAEAFGIPHTHALVDGSNHGLMHQLGLAGAKPFLMPTRTLLAWDEQVKTQQARAELKSLDEGMTPAFMNSMSTLMLAYKRAGRYYVFESPDALSAGDEVLCITLG